MDNVTRNLSDRDVQSSGETSTGAVSTFSGELEQGSPVASLEAARRAQTNRDLQRWIDSVLPAIREFLRLPVGWDTYHGQPVKLETGMFALQLLYDVMTPRVPIPVVGPTSPGGIQFEWHQGQIEIELFINAPYDCELIVRDRSSGAEDAFQITTDFSELTRAMLRLQSARQVAA